MRTLTTGASPRACAPFVVLAVVSVRPFVTCGSARAGGGGGKQPQRHEHPKEHGKETDRSLPVLYQRARTSMSTAP